MTAGTAGTAITGSTGPAPPVPPAPALVLPVFQALLPTAAKELLATVPFSLLIASALLVLNEFVKLAVATLPFAAAALP
ncbi:hypothetical protein ACTMU2_37075 [Cupriavidus basilensis]